MFRSSRIAGAALVLVASCAPAAPRLHVPDRITAFCEDRAALLTAVESIVASSAEVSPSAPIPSPAQERAMLKRDGGLIGTWTKDQPLYEPALAKAAGVSGDYVDVRRVVIDNAVAVGLTRPIYLTVATASGPRTFEVSAHDVQDVCNAGKLKS